MALSGVVWILLALVVILVIAYVAKYIIDAFFPAPLQLPILALVGVILLLCLLWAAQRQFGFGFPH